MTDIEAAWVAGLLEGEGSFFARNKSSSGMLNPVISINMTDHDVLEKLAATVGVGRVRDMPLRYERLGTKRSWCWTVTRVAEARPLCLQLLPHLGERRSAQVAEVLDACDLLLKRYAPRPPKGTQNAAKTHCKHGHEFTVENTYRYPNAKGGISRHCKTCAIARAHASAA